MKADPYSQYRNMLATRYASKAMSSLFSERHRAEVWRELWIYLADEERKLGLPITTQQVKALEQAAKDIDFEKIRGFEKKLKHDVMSHVKAFGEKAPQAEPIIHLGATSAFITDNADAILLKEGTELLVSKLSNLLNMMKTLSLKYAKLEMVGYTHFQPAQPVTLGKRIAMWAQDILWDVQELLSALAKYEPLGCKGTTGTQASFLVLFSNDFKKVRALDQAIVKRMGFGKAVALSGQTLSRKADVWFVQALANLGASFSKMSYDCRLLQHTFEVSEPFGEDQVGSSAMPYKQNPMLAERMTGLSRFLMSLAQNANWTHATQWLERSLDDSSNRRLVIPEAFLAADALCEIAHRLLSGIRVNEKLIAENLSKYANIFATEAMMMKETLKGGSRQKLHEQIRKASISGKLKSIKNKQILSGAAEAQVKNFVEERLNPFLKDLKKRSHRWKTAHFEAASV